MKCVIKLFTLLNQLMEKNPNHKSDPNVKYMTVLYVFLSFCYLELKLVNIFTASLTL